MTHERVWVEAGSSELERAVESSFLRRSIVADDVMHESALPGLAGSVDDNDASVGERGDEIVLGKPTDVGYESRIASPSLQNGHPLIPDWPAP